jgi:hypothetical protein
VHKASSGALTLAKRVESVLGVNPGTAGEINRRRRAARREPLAKTLLGDAERNLDLARLADPPPRLRRRRA